MKAFCARARDPRTTDAARSSSRPPRPSCRGSRARRARHAPTACAGSRHDRPGAAARDRAARRRRSGRSTSPATGSSTTAGRRRRIARELPRRRAPTIRTGARVTGDPADGRRASISRPRAGDVRAPPLVNCAGLYSDRVARLAGARPGRRIIPFRGEYYMLRPERARPRARPDLPGARSRVPVPRRPLHAHGPRRRRGGPQRGAGVRARGLPLRTRFDLRELAGTLGYPRLLGAWPAATGGWAAARCTARSARRRSSRRSSGCCPSIGPADITPGGAGRPRPGRRRGRDAGRRLPHRPVRRTRSTS